MEKRETLDCFRSTDVHRPGTLETPTIKPIKILQDSLEN